MGKDNLFGCLVFTRPLPQAVLTWLTYIHTKSALVDFHFKNKKSEIF